MTSTREELVEGTELSEREVRDIFEGIEDEFENQLGTDGNNKSLVIDISGAVKRQASDYVADLDAKGGPEVSQDEIRQALNQLKPETMQTVAFRLVSGNVQDANDSLSANTNLTNRQVNDSVEGVNWVRKAHDEFTSRNVFAFSFATKTKAASSRSFRSKRDIEATVTYHIYIERRNNALLNRWPDWLDTCCAACLCAVAKRRSRWRRPTHAISLCRIRTVGSDDGNDTNFVRPLSRCRRFHRW